MATTTKPPKVTPADVERFKANKGRVTDYYEFNADSIHAKKTVLATALIFAEMRWLCEECNRLGVTDALPKADLPRFDRILMVVGRVCAEQEGAVASGAFIKVRADIFAAYRFLVRAVEACLKRVLDLEDQFALGGRMAAEHQDRIVLDLEDGLGDDDAPE